MMLGPQPDLEVREGAGPIEYLNEKGEEKSDDMKDLYPPIFYTPKGTQK